MTNSTEEKLDRLIASRFALSRRQAEEVIKDGEVSIAGEICKDPVRLVDPAMEPVFWKSTALPKKAPLGMVYLFHKPRGVVCSTERQKGERLVTDYFPENERVYPAGRLDKESDGLIVVTNIGEVALELTHPRFEHKKTYRVIGAPREKNGVLPDAEKLIQKLEKGVKLGDGKAFAERVTIQRLDATHYSIQLTVREGRHHLVRRMLATLGVSVERLTRIAIGGLRLDYLKAGEIKQISPELVRAALKD